jgi:two-component system chemotaxis response regulator CheY
MPNPRVLSVGQCAIDQGAMSRFFQSHFQADVTAAATAEHALADLRARSVDLVLVNRIGDRDGVPGTELIRSLKADPALAAVPVMLVSNYAEAQQEAVGLGAVPGFGKAELGTEKAVEAIRAALTTCPLS